jgi:hypothetical protein
MPLRRIASATVLTLLAAAILVPARASATTRWDYNAGTKITPGDARTYGSFDISQQGRHIDFRGSIDDLCPNDGYGAYLTVYVYTANGNAHYLGDAHDGGGCAGVGTAFSWSGTYGSKVQTIEFHLAEFDQKTLRNCDEQWFWIDRFVGG